MIDKNYVVGKTDRIADLKKKAKQLLSKAENEECELRGLVKDDVFKYLEICNRGDSFVNNVKNGFRFAKFDGYSIFHQIHMTYGFDISLDEINEALKTYSNGGGYEV